MVRRALLLIIALASASFADTGFPSNISVKTTDNATQCSAGQIRFSPGTLSCAGNVATVTTGGGGGVAGVVLKSSNNTLCGTTILTTGNLKTDVVSSIPSSELYPNQLVLKDSGGTFWTVTVDNTCHLVTTAGGSFPQSANYLFLNDANSVSWVLTVSTLGNLITS